MDERSLDERVAELEALFEEARRRTRPRRQRNTALVLLAVLAGLAAANAGGSGVRKEVAGSESSSARPAVDVQQIGRWSIPYGPASGADLVVVDPKNSGILYAAAGGRVYRSADGGATWVGGLQIDPRVDALAVDPQRPPTLYAGTGAGVFKSVDAGRSWVWSGLGQTPRLPGGVRGEGNVVAILIDPTNANVVYAVAGTRHGHVSKSTDGGRTWRTLSASPAGIAALALDPASPQTLFAAGNDPWIGIAMSTDGGASWRTVLSPSGYLESIAVDPADPGIVYAVDSTGVLVSTDGGLTWSSTR